jgi:2-polyprenyl-3-methyl-5-hydroxy-6-metoxy-1,4-benzoquinol methylase
MSEIDPQIKAVFRRDAFEVTSLEQAMAVTVTPERGASTAERWQNETRYLVEDIGGFLAVDPQSCVLDYGCGTGRIAKELIATHGCRVVGVDASQSLRLLAPDYVLSERFAVWSPETLDKMIAKGFRADSCICLWVIQHALSATEVIDRIWRVLNPGGLLYSLNQLTRCVPTDKGWINDGFDMRAGLRRMFVEENIHPLPASVSTARFEASTMIQVLRKPTA